MSERELSTQVLVIGGGAAGVAAALTAAEAGVQVLLLEQSDTLGGASLRAETAFFVPEGASCTPRAAYDEAMYFANYLCDPVLMRLAVFSSGESLAWANARGAGFAPAGERAGRNGLRYPQYRWDGPRAFAAGAERLAALPNVQVCLRTTAVLLTQAEGAVTGAVAREADGGRLTVRADCVCLATGGYLGSEPMLADAVGTDRAQALETQADGDGAGIRMAWKAGAAKAGTKALTLAGITAARDPAQYPLLVNRQGRRFMDETLPRREPMLAANCLLTQGGTAWLLCAGAAAEAEPLRADSLPALAQRMGIDADALAGTVSAYNAACAAGRDADFFKVPAALQPLSTPPYAAREVQVCAQDSAGGAAVNRNMQTVDEAGRPVPGLYVCGTAAGGLCAASGSILPGLPLSWALTGGRTAGAAMARKLTNREAQA